MQFVCTYVGGTRMRFNVLISTWTGDKTGVIQFGSCATQYLIVNVIVFFFFNLSTQKQFN